MIITKTPFRVSFFGGGTDYPDWFRRYGGGFLSMAIDKYCYLSIRKLPPFFEHKHRLVYSKVENVLHESEFEHPVVREVLKWKGVPDGLEIHHDGDLPARSGLGSSSAFTVGLLHGLNGLQGNISSKDSLANDAIYAESTLLEETVGIQDQIAAAYGGLNSVEIEKNGQYHISPVVLSRDVVKEFEAHVLLCFTGISRFASKIAKEKVGGFASKVEVLSQMRDMVSIGQDYLSQGRLDQFASLLDESWMLKRSLSNLVTSPAIDDLYALAKKKGAMGGKLLGAGGGGFLMFLVPPSVQEDFKSALKDFVFVHPKIDWSGSQVAFYQPEGI